MKKLILLLAIILLLAGSKTALALDTSDAVYTAVIRVTNNSTEAATNVSVPFTANTSVYIAAEYMNDSANNTAITSSSGATVVYMPGFGGTYPWVIDVPSIGANNILSDTLYMGGTTNMGGKIRYFPASGGMQVSDNASLELSDNFTISISGRIDTDNGTGKNLINKEGAIKVFVSPEVSENITLSIDFTLDTAYEGTEVDGTGGPVERSQVYTTNPATSENWTAAEIDELELGVTLKNDAAQQTRVYKVWASVNFSGTFEILNPVGEGVETNIPSVSGTTHWGAVADSDNTTFVYTTAAGYSRDTYTLSNTTLTGAITGVTVYMDIGTAAAAKGKPVWASITPVDLITATGVTSGEQVITVRKNNTFMGIAQNNNIADLPLGDSLILNTPLYLEALNISPFTSIDTNESSCNVTEAVWSTQGYLFDGINDIIVCADNTGESGNAAFSIEAWVYFPALANWDVLIFWGDGGVALKAASLVVMGDGDAGLAFAGGHIAFAGEIISTDTWYHLVATKAAGAINTTTNIYLNGVLQTLDGNESVGTPNITNGPPTIGGNTAFGYANVRMGEARIYSDVLTPSEIIFNYNATKWLYDGTSSDFWNYVLSESGVPDTSANWAFCQNNVVPYMETANITIGGNLQGSWEWEYDETFTDLSGNSHDATPTFRSTSSDTDITAALVNFRPITEARAPAFSVNITTTGWITADVSQTGNFTAATTNTTYPGSIIISEVATAGSVPLQLLEIILAGVIILSLSLFISWVMRTNREGSLFFKILIISAGLGIMIAVSVVDEWILWLFLMISIAIAMAASQRTFTGTGNAGNNMIGFLAMSFVGMTTINRILEGRFIQSADVDLLRNTLAFQPFDVFGLFTIPVPNTDFLLNGIPALIRWDYSFFGGNAQIFQYLLYSITAVVSFMLFVLVFGAIYQMFARR